MYIVPLNSLPHINKMVGKQGEIPPPPIPSSSSFLSGATPTKPDASSFSFRVKIFTHTISLIGDDKIVHVPCFKPIASIIYLTL